MKLFELLKSLHDRLLEFSRELKFDKKNRIYFSQIALYGTLIEFAGAITTLIEHRGRIAVPSVFRSFLEAAVELRNLNSDPAYIEHMYAGHVKHWLDVMNEAKKGNPYLTKIGAEPNLDDAIAKDEAALAELVAKKKGPLQVFQRFKLAGMVQEYESMYNFLSCDAHSNIRALVDRHFEECDEDFNLAYYKDEPLESFAATLDGTVALLLQASLDTHKAFDSKRIADIESMLAEFAAVRSEYVA